MPSQQLQSNCLSFTELLAQAVALISPTMTAALIIPVMYSPYIFLLYLALGIAWVLAFHKWRPSASMSIREDLQVHHDRHQASGEIAAAAE